MRREMVVKSLLLCGAICALAAQVAWGQSGRPPRPGRRQPAGTPTFKWSIPKTAVPDGYGRYCSLSYPGGGWAFATLSGANSDPCADMLRSKPGGTIARAGLWDTRGANNVLWLCDQGLGIYREQGSKATAFAHDDATSKKKTGCVFVVSPTNLPVFGLPYGKTTSTQSDPNDDVGAPNSFNYNVYHGGGNVADFGQTPLAGDPTAEWVDRKGRQRTNIFESAYDWSMPEGKPILSVAAGRVLAARSREVDKEFNCGADRQKEVYVEHQIGEGEYAERFVTYYAHLSSFSVKTGDAVTRGQKLGEAGHTGCARGDVDHLHFSVHRLTNLSGHRRHAFALTDDGYGINGIRGVIDPFGWAAPKDIDPWAWKYLNGREYNDNFSGTIKVRNPGAFSINLWMGQTPPID